MRQFSNDFANHIALGETNLATCWRITRQDGIVLGFSNHDEELEFDNTIFKPNFGADIGEVASKLGAQTDSSEIVGIINSDSISEKDILLGFYDGAKVETFMVNWKDPNMHELLRTDYIGEITRTDNIFRVELRSAQVELNIAKGKIYQSFCNARLGDNDCTIDLEQPQYKTDIIVNEIRDDFTIITDLISGIDNGYFSFGKAIWLDGERKNKADIITKHNNIDNQSHISFSEPIRDWVKIGDSLTIYAGCNRHFDTCRDKFSNIINFRGFPHIPGDDFILRYPTKSSQFNAEPLVK